MIDIRGRISGNKQDIGKKHVQDSYHNFMMIYGWIPWKEFQDIPLSQYFTLMNKVNMEIGRRKAFMNGVLRGQGFKNPQL